MINLSLSQTQKDDQLTVFGRETVIALIIQLGGLSLTYLLQIFLAQWMGRTEYGIYEFVMSCALLLSIPAGLGFPHTVLRLIPEYRVQENWTQLHGVVRGSWLLTILTSLVLMVLVTGGILTVNHFHPFVYAIPLLFGMGLVLLQALVRLQQEAARAMDDILLAFAPAQILFPLLVLSSGFLTLQWNQDLTSLPMIGIASLMFLIIVGFQFGLLRWKLNHEFVPATPAYTYREWLKIALVLLIQQISSGLLSITDIVIIGVVMGPESAGIYDAAVKTSLWTSFVIKIVNMVAAPMFTTLYIKGDIPGLQKIVSSATLWIFYPTIAIALCLMVFTQPILSLFGSGFIAADWSLKILVIGQLVNALCGSVGYLMIMTGHQNQSFRVITWSALLNVALNAILIPFFGIVGSAIATSLSMIVWNVWLGSLVVQYIGVHPSVFYSLFQQGSSSKEVNS